MAVSAHRTAWELSHGTEIPADLHVLHSCDIPLCVNPNHLTLGTHLDNMQDASRKGRLKVQRPGRHKLSDGQIRDVLRRVAAGELQVRLAHEYGVTKSHICQLVSGHSTRTMRLRKKGAA
jgi:hypothetical protein